MTTGELSVLLPVYSKDKPAEFSLAFSSIIEQTEMASQIVIVQDGPIESSLEHELTSAAELAMRKGVAFQRVVNKTNLGLGLALNRGLEAITCDYVARMDADDISKPNRFACQLEVLRGGVDLCYSSSEEFEYDHNKIRCINVAPPAEKLPTILNFRNPVVHPSIMFRRETASRIGGYRDMLFFEDYDFILRMIKSGAQLRGITQPLISFRSLPRQRARRGGLWYFRQGSLNRIRWIRENLIHPLWGPLSLFPFAAYTLSPATLRSSVHCLLRQSAKATKSLRAEPKH